MNIFDKRPLFLILTVAISGFVGFTFSGGILKGILCAVALFLLILSLFLFYKKRINTNPLLIILPAILLVSMICSFIYFELYFKLYNHFEDEVVIEGKIVSYENDNYPSIEHEYILTNVYDLEQRKNVVRLYNYLKNTQKNSLDFQRTK